MSKGSREDGKNFNLPFEVYADLTRQALLLVDLRAQEVLHMSAAARSVLFENDEIQPASISLSHVIQCDGDIVERLELALTSTAPITFGVTALQSGQRLAAKAQRFTFADRGPLLIISVDPEPELSRRFIALSAQLLALNQEIVQRREAERELSLTTASLRRCLEVARHLSEISTTEGKHLALATAAVRNALGFGDTALILRSGKHFFCRCQMGETFSSIEGDRPLDLPALPSLLDMWFDRSVERDAFLRKAIGHAIGGHEPLDAALVIPIAALGEPIGLIIAMPILSEAATKISSLEIGLIGEALSSLFVRGDVEARLLHGQKLEAIGRLTGGIAHDFNNILAVVLGNAELLLDEVTKGDGDLAREIQDAAQRGALLTSRLLSFARKQALRPENADVNALLREVDSMVRRSVGTNVDLQVVASAGLWRAVIDRHQFEAALLNLAVNARDAMPDGGKLTLETGNARLDDEYVARHEEVAAGQYVMVAVSDTGTGMDAATAELAFSPFFTTKEDGKGSGLGLSMVFGFVKQSGGHIKIYSELGSGTTIRMYFPRDPKDIENELKNLVGEVANNNQTILLVEDDPAVLRYTVRTLNILGFAVTAVSSGAQAIALIDRNHYDLILTDVMLPGGINGRTIAQHARSVSPNTPVLFMSGYTENAIIHHGRLEADAELLTKPFTREQLSQKLKSLLET